MKRIIFVLLLFSSFYGWPQSTDAFFKKADAFFNTYVKEGKVAYADLHKNSEELSELLNIAKAVSVSKNEANNYQAFWINAYNLSVIKGILNHYPTKSPLDHAGFFDNTEYELAGAKITLNDIEHKLLRAQFNDPRFHFVLVCGALGCPPLIAEAYLPETLDEQLNIQTKKAINGSFLKVNFKKKRVEASQIMEWYKDDFRVKGSTELDFVNKYRTEKIPNDFKLKYFPYNWSLNEQ